MNNLRDFSAASALSVVAALALVSSSPAAARSSRPAAAAADTGSIVEFYRARGGAPLWFGPASGNAAQQALQLLGTAWADNLNPNRYHVRALAKAVQGASSGDPVAVQRAETMLSQAFATYVRDVRHDPHGIIYVDAELKPTPPSALTVLNQAAAAPSLAEYRRQNGLDEPDLRPASPSAR